MKYSPNQLPLFFNEPTAEFSPVVEEVVEEQTNSRPGYKHTALGWIPEDWEVRAVGEICDFIVPGRNRPSEFSGDIPWITTPDIEGNKVVYRSKIDLRISKEEAKRIGSKVVPRNSIIITCVGDLGLVTSAGADLVMNQQLHAFIPTKVIESDFLLYALSAQRKYMERIATKTAVPYMNKDNCNSIPVPIPPLPEQKAIAAVLSSWDKAIDKTQTLIAAKEQRKKWLMGQLLTGKKRLTGFGGEWKKTGAGKIFINSSLKGYANEELLSVTQDNGVIPRSMLEARVTMPSGETGSFKLVETGDFVISLRSFQGGLEYSYYKGIVSPAYTVLKPRNRINPEFYKFYFKSYDFIGHLAVAVIGIRDGKQINYEEFCTVEIPDPSEQEQTAIAAILQAADREIGLLRQKLEKLKEQKKGLMQVLLTGKVRLRTAKQSTHEL